MSVRPAPYGRHRSVASPCAVGCECVPPQWPYGPRLSALALAHKCAPQLGAPRPTSVTREAVKKSRARFATPNDLWVRTSANAPRTGSRVRVGGEATAQHPVPASNEPATAALRDQDPAKGFIFRSLGLISRRSTLGSRGACDGSQWVANEQSE